MFNSSSAASATVDTFTVTLKKTDNTVDNETTLGTYSNTITTYNYMSKVNTTWLKGETGNAVTDYEDTIVLPFYIPVEEKKINVDEKLILTIAYTSTGGTVWIGHYNGTDPDDIKLKVPYVPAG